MSDIANPLYSQEAEEALVGSILIQPGILASLSIEPAELYLHRLRFIVEACYVLHRAQISIDILTLSEELDRRGRLDEIGGPTYLTTLINNTPSYMSVESYERICKDYARRRKWRDLASKVAKYAFDMDAALEEIAPEIIDDLMNAVRVYGAATHISKHTPDLLEEIVDRMEDPQEIWGIPTGFRDFDAITGGLQGGEVLYISGKPGARKSMIAMQSAMQMAQDGQPGAIYSMEMKSKQVLRRWISWLAKVPARGLKTGQFPPEKLKTISEQISMLDRLPLYISEDVKWTSGSLRSDLARLKAQFGVRWFVLDYAYLLKDGAGMNENDRTGYISSQMKSICRSLDLAGVVIHSLRKSYGAPDIDDLRGSGQQGYDTDLLMFVSKTDDENTILCAFGKGRELERDKQTFKLTTIPLYPAVADYAEEPNAQRIDKSNGRN